MSRILPNLSIAFKDSYLKKRGVKSFLRIVMMSQFNAVDKVLITMDNRVTTLRITWG